ncbi:MAG TPA: DNA translocase FtsK [Solirubrobacteraceae bacterium]|jgi:S-DNA-T family DNA segregation ATPase FtsK/SpoIIIE|nr:DNA translocase FtsK [Solirubrobacteraceae bacterium]
MPTTRKRAPARSSGKRRRSSTRSRAGGRGPRGGLGALRGALPRVPELDQRQRDVLGLALLALGVFMGIVLYGAGGSTRDAGGLGHGLAVGFGWALGRARVLAPLALALGGGTLLLRPVLPALRPLRTGASCVFAAVTLALAAGMLGLSSRERGLAPTGSRAWASSYLQAHGGVLGQALYAVTHKLVQQVGVDILVVFLLIAGAVLLTGASIAGAIRMTAGGVLDSTRVVRGLGRREQPAARGRGARAAAAAAASAEQPAEADSLMPPEPDPRELIVRATHVEAPSREELPGEEEPFDWDEQSSGQPAGQPGREPPAEQPQGAEPDSEPAQADIEREQLPGVAYAASSAEVDPADLTPQGRLRGAVTDDPAFVWELPDAARLLTRSTSEQTRPDTAGQERTAANLVEALGHFGVQARVIGTVAGPHITRYELRLAPGTKVAKVAQLKDDLAYALAATDIRILAPIPGKQAVGVEVPNAKRRIVRLGDVYQQPPKDWSPLTVWLGKDVAGKAIGADLAKMPHILVAGTTGAGKSGAINAMLSSILLRATPHEVRLVLVDPKQVELNHYESIPHLLTPVITSPRMAANALQNLVKEMESRYGIMSLARTRGLVELNASRAKRGEAPLPYILCVIDELADLMMVAPADVEDSIIRLAQKARAVGIHLVLATQSPRVDVITGMIKANVPSRIAFAVSSQTDSRVILDQNGAESLLGQGDMLFSPVGSSRLQRIQGAYIDEAQIERLTEGWRRQGEPELREELLEEVEPEDGAGAGSGEGELDPDEDPLLRDAIVLVAEMQTASTSMLQRRLRLGYTRAGRMIDMLERRGVISGYEGSKPRQVLITEADLPRVLATLDPAAAQPAASPTD